jgi:hypothetical protein
MCPAGTIQARFAVSPQPAPFGTLGIVPAKIIPWDDDIGHQNCLAVSTGQRPGTDSCAWRNGTGAQPPRVAGGRGDASAPLTGPTTTAASAVTAASRQPRQPRSAS